MLGWPTFDKCSSPNSTSKCTLIRVSKQIWTFVWWIIFYSWLTDGEDYTALWNTLRESISMVKGPEKYGPGQASFAHITGGYDAGYYGYPYPLFIHYYTNPRITIGTCILSFLPLICMRRCLRRTPWILLLDRDTGTQSSGWVEVGRRPSHSKCGPRYHQQFVTWLIDHFRIFLVGLRPQKHSWGSCSALCRPQIFDWLTLDISKSIAMVRGKMGDKYRKILYLRDPCPTAMEIS